MSENRQIVSSATHQGELILSIVQNEIPTPNDEEVIVKMEAAPIVEQECISAFSVFIIRCLFLIYVLIMHPVHATARTIAAETIDPKITYPS